jgi:hypothetical protein
VANISIWDLVMSGWPLNLGGLIVSMDGKETILIGETTPFAMIVSEEMPMDMISQGMTKKGEERLHRRRRRKTNIDWRSWNC